jgi:alkanesulfonate monooxygenase SsuD/methylene tetrahydromethanopterin reductase-like flavin-dependent oxidoreductase (luciferase family)
MEFGLCTANIGTYADPRAVARLAVAAERAGWDGVFVWDHLGFVWGPPAGDPWILLAAAAAATSRIRLGTTVTPVARRRPQVLAQTVTTLDLLAGGNRVVFGAGLGGQATEFTAFGEDADEHVRAERLDEGLEVLRRLWSAERVTHRGRHFTVAGVTLAPAPASCPIWIGGNSAAALRRAARFDGWVPDTADEERMTMAPDELAAGVETIRALRASDDPFAVAVLGYGDGTLEWPRAYGAAGATWWLESIHDLRGSPEELLALVAAGPPRGAPSGK